MAHLLASLGKPLINDELIKSCLTIAAKEICLEKTNLFGIISLWARTVGQGVEDTDSSINKDILFIN